MYFKVKINTYPPYVVMLVKMPTKICLFRRHRVVGKYLLFHHLTKDITSQKLLGSKIFQVNFTH